MWRDQKTGSIATTYADVRALRPGQSLPADMTDADVLGDGFDVVTPTPPRYDPTMQSATPAAPEFINGAWVQQWVVAPLTPEQIAANTPQVCTRTQAFMALSDAGLLDHIDAYCKAQGGHVLIAWENENEFHRGSPMLRAIAMGLNLSSAQIDALFVAASSIEV